MTQDSFVGRLLRDSQAKQQIIPSAMESLGGRQVYRPTAPAPTQPNQDKPPIDTGFQLPPPAALDNESMGASGGQMPQMQNPASINASIDAEFPEEDINFYTRTGRYPSQIDKMMLAAKRDFFTSKGKLPSPSELMYEVQRGMMQTYDPRIRGSL